MGILATSERILEVMSRNGTVDTDCLARLLGKPSLNQEDLFALECLVKSEEIEQSAIYSRDHCLRYGPLYRKKLASVDPELAKAIRQARKEHADNVQAWKDARKAYQDSLVNKRESANRLHQLQMKAWEQRKR